VQLAKGVPHKRAHADVPIKEINVSPGVDSTTLTSGLFVLAALFVRTAVATLTRVESTLTFAILTAFLLAASSASRMIVLRITSR
jgi:hypothetical protein